MSSDTTHYPVYLLLVVAGEFTQCNVVHIHEYYDHVGSHDGLVSSKAY